MNDLPHNPGSLSNQFINRSSQKTQETLNDPDSVLNLQVSGRDNATGDLYLSYPGSNVAVPATPTTEDNAYPGQRVQATRHTPQSGQRKVQCTTGKPTVTFVSINSSGTATKGATNPNEPEDSTDPCDDPGDDEGPDGPDEGSPGDPSAPGDPEGPNAGNPGDGGDGELQNPPAKYSCVGGQCIQDINGSFNTLDECLNSGCQPDQPEPSPDPNDPGNVGPDGENGSPSDSPDGEGNVDLPGGEPPFPGGQCDSVAYQWSGCINRVNNATGATDSPFSCNGFQAWGPLNVTLVEGPPIYNPTFDWTEIPVYLEITSRGQLFAYPGPSPTMITERVPVAQYLQENPYTFSSAGNWAVIRLDGQPDNCGDPPAIPPEL